MTRLEAIEMVLLWASITESNSCASDEEYQQHKAEVVEVFCALELDDLKPSEAAALKHLMGVVR